MRREFRIICRSGMVFLLSAMMIISGLSFLASNAKAQGQWSDTFADESKVFSKVDVEVVGGNAQIQQLATDYSWQKKGVVIDRGGAGDDDGKHALEPTVIIGPDGVYRMWYVGATLGDAYKLLYATSADGFDWAKQGAVISPGFSGTGYDSRRIYGCSVMYDGGLYKMWYTGVDSSDRRRTLYATSTDGETWQYVGVALGIGQPGETLAAAWPYVVKEGGAYKVWYSGYQTSYQLFYATSPDGETWTKQGLVMPLGSPGDPDDISILKNVVRKNSTGLYRMWYGGAGTVSRVLYAESADGIDWSNRYGVSLYEGPPGSLDESQVAPGSVFMPVEGAGYMWYTGWDVTMNTRAFIATMGSLGNLTSVEITKTPGYDWQTLFLNKTISPDDTQILVSVLNPTTLRPYPGLSGLTGTVIDLSSISKSEPSIRLRADFYGDISQSPILHDWTVTWDDTAGPLFAGLDSANDDGTGGSVTLNWNPATDPSTPIAYNVYMALTPMGQDFGSPNYTTQAISLQIPGLTNGVTYYFVVRAEDGLGHEESNTIERSVVPTTPIDSTPPTFAGIQSATDSGTGGNVTLSWNDATDPDTIECNSDPSLPITYNIYHSLTPGGQDFLTPNATTTNTLYEVTGLIDGSTYHFVVRAEDSVGNEEGNTVELDAIPTTPLDKTPPTFAGLGSVTDLGTGGAVRLTWNSADDPDTVYCNADPSLPISYNVYHSMSPGGQDFLNPNATTGDTQIDISGLQNGVFSYFVVRAVDSVGNEESNLIEKGALPTTNVDNTPPEFDGLQFAIDAGTGGKVSLSWQAANERDTVECNSDPSLPVSYDVFYSTTSGGQDFQSPDTTTQEVSLDISGLTNGVSYYFVVRARDSVGNQETNTVERTAIPTTPTDTTPPNFAGLESAFDSETGGSVTLIWSAATDPNTEECNSDPSEPVSYFVYVSTTQGGQNFLLPDGTTQNTQIEISGLENGVTHYFIVRARDAAGNEESNMIERSATPTAPILGGFSLLDYWWLILVVVVIVVVVILAVVLAMRGKKKVTPQMEAPPPVGPETMVQEEAPPQAPRNE